MACVFELRLYTPVCTPHVTCCRCCCNCCTCRPAPPPPPPPPHPPPPPSGLTGPPGNPRATSQYQANLHMKVNTKLGGTNHTWGVAPSTFMLPVRGGGG
jgi:hypothetical protein